MTKKKQKAATPQSKAGGSVGPSSPAELSSDICDLLTVRLAARGRSDASFRLPAVAMHAADMHRIDLQPGEPVLLLARALGSDGAPGGIVGAAVGRAAQDRTNATTTTPLARQTVRLGPASVVAALLGKDADPEGMEAAAAPGPATPLSVTSPPPPASPPPSRFSFKQGGGGDRLYSPASIKAPSPGPSGGGHRTPRNSSAAIPRNPLWLVPLESPLGQRLQPQLIQTAERLELRVLDDNTALHNLAECGAVAQRVVLAQLVGRHLQLQETVAVSFRGRPLPLRVVETHAADTIAAGSTTTDNLRSLEDTMERLRLAGPDDNGAEPDPEVAELLATLADCPIRLLEVTHETRIDLLTADVASTDNSVVPALGPIPEQHVAGLASTLEEVRAFFLTPLAHPELFRGNLRPPRGLLLYGVSGTGKTCLAKQLAAELRQLFRVKYVNCVSLQSKTSIVGEAENEVSRLFRTNTDSGKPQLLIMDDIDLICPKRGGRNTGTDRLAATLLSLIDGIDSSENRTVLLAITSNPSALDPALRRPGRLDTEVEVPLPDEPPVRADILRFHLDRLGARLPSTTDWNDLGRLAKGFTGADCMLAAKEAVRNTIMKKDTKNVPSPNATEATEVAVATVKAAIKDTKPSAIKAVTVEIPHVKWSDIGGMESVKKSLREAIEVPLLHAESMAKLKLPAPRGILLYGPPGCSKTLMARALATEGRMNFLAVKGPELLSKWLGESERALASLFRRARMASPSIIFFDEIDAIATKRGSSDSASSSRLLSQLLTELDGVTHTATDGKKHRVVIVGATNRPDLLDPALTRPGRIDRMIYVGVPDFESRKSIFELSLRGRACGKDIDLVALAHDELSGGYSGAEIVAICRDAAFLALGDADDPKAKDLPTIDMKHLLAAVRDMQRQITPQMLDFYMSFKNSYNNRMRD